jgi:hypothetical protein
VDLSVSRGEGGSGRELVVQGGRLDGPGAFRQRLSAIGSSTDRGPPAYASIIDIPVPGCWRLRLMTGRLKTYVDLRALPTRG